MSENISALVDDYQDIHLKLLNATNFGDLHKENKQSVGKEFLLRNILVLRSVVLLCRQIIVGLYVFQDSGGGHLEFMHG